MKHGNDGTICIEPRCKNRRKKGYRRCPTCVSRKWRAEHPMYAAYRAVKDHAKARKSKFWPNGIPFTLTLAQFRKFAVQSEYLNRKGNGKRCLTIDRRDATRGYVPGNIQPLTREANRMKQAKQDAIRMGEGMKWKENNDETHD